MIQGHDLCLSFNNQVIFDHISFIINQNDTIGLVGRNGSGKTTLLTAIMDSSVLDKGTIALSSKKKIAYMPQEVVLDSVLSIFEETFSAFSQAYAVEQEARTLEKIVAGSVDPHLLERYAFLQEQIMALSVDPLKAQVKKMLMGLGFTIPQFEQPVNSLSVGWKMRIVLAKLLLQEADFYLFDEPTNHLDLIAKEWFLNFLKQADFGFMLICHERYFLDELCTKILELERGKATWYSGNYSDYLIQKEHALELVEAAYIQQQKEIQRKQATIERFRASASKARMAQSMEKSLEKMERIEIPPTSKNVHFNFPPVQQAGKIVVKGEHVSQAFGNKTIFQNVSFEIEREQKVALVAPNGAGKTTLFNLIAGILPLQKGTVTFGYNVTSAIFAQDQNKVLQGDLTILENIRNLCPQASEQKIRTFLGAFLFSGEDALKKVAVLSGGEKNRVGMVSVLLQNANFLLLDEPTNHLDIPSKEILLKALQEFKGTLLFVSHDRDFINSLATDIMELTSQGVYTYKGNYDAYTYHKQQLAAPSLKNEKPAQSKPILKGAKSFSEADLHKAIKQIENKISKLEQRIKALDLSFESLEYGTIEFSDAAKKLATLQKELQEAEKTWEKLQQELL
jgi:ATP-binding cassette subfamily F protein 3